MLLANKVCVITGAASRRGIGRAIAKLFALHGGRSIILDLDAGQASDAASELGDAHRGFACDVTDRNACVSAIERVVSEFGQVDVLVNNAGITQPLKLMDISTRELRRGARRQPARHALHEPGGDPADAPAAFGLHRLHVVGLGPARRRHLRRPALQRRQGRRTGSRQGHGPRAGPRQHPRQLDHPRPDPDRHHRRQAHRRRSRSRSSKASRSTASATPTMSPGPACSWPPISPPTSPAPSSTSTAAC